MSLELNNYYNEIRSDIAKEFGFQALGYGVKDTRIPVRIAQRIANKHGVTPRGIAIAKRYRSLVMGVK